MSNLQNDKDPESTKTHNDVEVTQKIDFNYKESFGDETAKLISLSSKSLASISVTNLFKDNFLFTKKSIPDDYVKASSIDCMISSISALESEAKLQDINDNYVLKDQISEGAQGVVWTGFDKSLKRDIIVKSAKSGRDEDDVIRSNDFFVSEARIMAQLDHPAIVPIYGMFSDSEEKLH